jgi:hypothetical protein
MMLLVTVLTFRFESQSDFFDADVPQSILPGADSAGRHQTTQA